MPDVTTPGIILKTRIVNGYDRSIDVFTREMGRLDAVAVSGAKINSRLSPHLKVGVLSILRLACRNRNIITDAFSESETTLDSVHLAKCLELLFLLRHVSPHNVPDPVFFDYLAHSLRERKYAATIILKHFGYDTSYAACDRCAAKDVSVFDVSRHVFFCANCAMKARDIGSVAKNFVRYK